MVQFDIVITVIKLNRATEYFLLTQKILSKNPWICVIPRRTWFTNDLKREQKKDKRM